ncbi:MAG: 4-alpha-glucanotransferase [Gammaproteobacteria bacterium]
MVGAVGPLSQRRAGILLHPTSLPGGVLGPEAFRFVDFLAASGMSVWQTLPLGPTHNDGSPYQCLSVHAGNPRLISLELLAELGWLNNDAAIPVDADPEAHRCACFIESRRGFMQRASDEERAALDAFVVKQGFWLDDFALYQALRQENDGRAWLDWPVSLRDRETDALDRARVRLVDAIEQACFEEYVFFRQWQNLKRYANERGVLLFGDMPIFVAHDSAEVWAHREYFMLDEEGRAQVVAGVPPDYFSATGQRWGNPHYNWGCMQADGFHWWVERMTTQLAQFDLIRIDHFRGFEAYWEIPAHAETAIDGRWVKAPGDELFQALQETFNPLPLVAEDLGIITPEVDALREKYGLPGMKILQFAFEGGASNPYLSYNHQHNSVVYTGTHDNNTTVGWFEELSSPLQQHILEYLGLPQEVMPWPLIRCAFASVAQLAIVPMQDVLALDGEHRMNLPGTTKSNWSWRFDWEQVPEELSGRLHRLAEIYGRR